MHHDGRAHHTVEPISPEQAQHLMAQSRELQASLYPATSIHQVDDEKLATSPNVLLGAFSASSPDTAVGCVGLLLEGQEPRTAEVKSLFVMQELRGQGIGNTLMDTLEQRALGSGITLLRLETGIYQPESLRLYAARGYQVVPRFGEYPEDPLSVFMHKTLP
jgi:putative acetyltransferase